MNYNTYTSLINLKPKKNILFCFLIFITLFLVILLFEIDFTDTLILDGIYKEKSFEVKVSLKDSDTINEKTFIKIDNINYYYEIESISDLYLENNNNYYIYRIKINQNFKENEVKKIVIIKEKQKVIKKIINSL